MYWNSRLHDGIKKSWDLPLGGKFRGRWSKFPMNPDVCRWARGEADSESAISGAGTRLTLPKVTAIGSLVSRKICSFFGSQSLSPKHLSTGSDSVLRRKTSEPQSLTTGLDRLSSI